MRYRIFASFMVVLFGTMMAPLCGLTVTIGDNYSTSTTSYFPLNCYYDYSYSQQIYTQAQIGTAGEITKLRFNYYSGTPTYSSSWVIYLGHTTRTNFPGTSSSHWIPSAQMTQVFSGTVVFPSSPGWMEIVLNTPFQYNNINNLVVAVDENSYNSAPGNVLWQGFSSSLNSGIYHYSNTVNANPASPPTAINTNAFLSEIQFVFTDTTPPDPPINPSPANLASNADINSILSWQFTNIEGQSYDLYFGTTSPPPFIGNQIGRSYNPGPMAYETTYYWQVIPKNQYGDAQNCPIWSFTTWPDPTIYNFPFQEGFNANPFPPLGWKQTIVSGNYGFMRISGTSSSPAINSSFEGASRMYYPGSTMGGDANAWLVTPEIAMADTTKQYQVRLAFWKDSTSFITDSLDRIELYLNTTQNLAGNPALVGTIHRTKSISPVELTADGWYQYRFDLGRGTGQTKYLIIKAVNATWNGYGNGMNIDLLEVFEHSALDIAQPAVSPRPLHNSINQSIRPSLRWENGGGVVSGYQLYMGTSPDSLALISEQTGTSYTFGTNLLWSTQYFWRVDTSNAFGTSSGVLWNFTTEAASILASSPTNAANGVALTAVLNWQDVYSATGYLISVGTLSGTSDIADRIFCPESQWNLGANWLYAQTYFWRVIALNGDQEMQGSEWTFSTLSGQPQIGTPSNGQTLVNLNAALSWQAVSGASGYLIDVGTTVGSTDVAERIACSEPQWVNPGAWQFASTYYWRVYVLNGAQEISGPAWSFSTIPVTFGTPAPSPNAVNIALNSVFDWPDIQYVSSYKIQVGTISGASDVADVILCESSQWTPPANLLYGSSYYWKVYAIHDEQEFPGPEWSFSTLSGQPQLVSPANGQTLVNLNTTLSWQAVSGASGYLIDVGTTEGSADVAERIVCSEPQWVNPGAWQFATTYYWRVYVLNGAQEISGPVWSFSTIPVTFGTPAPAHSAVNIALNTVFNWPDIQYVSSYKIKVGTSSGASDVADMILCESSQWIPSSNLLYGGTYFWKVYAIQYDREYPGPEWSFSTLSGVATTPSPANNSTGINVLSKVLSWTAVTNATGYKVVAGTSVGASNLVNNVVVSTNRYTHPTTWPGSTTVYWQIYTLNGSQEIPSALWMFTTLALAALPYSEDFNASTSLPSGWSGNFYISPSHGKDGTNGMYEYLINFNSKTATTGLIGPLTNSVNLEFDYRFMAYNGYPANAHTLVASQYLVAQVSNNNGSTYNTISRIDRTNHVTTTSFTTWQINLNQSGFVSAGDIIRVRLICGSSSGIFYVDIDNVKLSAALYAPSPITPAHGSQNASLNGILDWSDVDLATSYRLNVGTSPGATDLANAEICTSSEWSFDTEFSYAQAYYWQVTALNGEAEFVAPEWNFTTMADINATNGYSLQLNGTSQYVDCGNPPGFNNLSAITLEAWIYPTNFLDAAHKNTIFGKDAWGTGPNQGFAFRYGSANRTLSFVMGNGGTGWNELVAPSVLNLNTWQHVAATYDGSFMRLFVNGTQVASLARTGVIPASSKNLFIGQSPAGTTRYMKGYIDEVRFWNQARTAAQIQANLYENILPEETLVAYYKMTNGNGTLLSDNSGNMNYARLMNGAVWAYEVPFGQLSSPLVSIAWDDVNQEVELSWEPIAGATWYGIYILDSPFQSIDPDTQVPDLVTNNTSFSISSVDHPHRFFRVIAGIGSVVRMPKE